MCGPRITNANAIASISGQPRGSGAAVNEDVSASSSRKEVTAVRDNDAHDAAVANETATEASTSTSTPQNQQQHQEAQAQARRPSTPDPLGGFFDDDSTSMGAEDAAAAAAFAAQHAQEDEYLGIDDFQGSEDALRARLERDLAKQMKSAAAPAAVDETTQQQEQQRQPQQPESPQQQPFVPAWMLSIIDEASTRVNTLQDEMNRLLMLQRFRILDEHSRDATLDRLTAMASRIFGVPIVCVDLVDLGRLKILSNHGLGPEACYCPRNDSFCSHAIQSRIKMGQLFVVPDTHEDVRFKDHWLVTGPTKIRFYAAANLIIEGHRVGTFCILDTKPWPKGLEADQELSLLDLANTATRVLMDRRDRFEAKEQMERAVASMAHDTMTPLTGIMMSLASLQETQKDDELVDHHSYLVDHHSHLVSSDSGRSHSTNKDDHPPSSSLVHRMMSTSSSPSSDHHRSHTANSKFSGEQREMIATAWYCAEALAKIHRSNQETLRGDLLPPAAKIQAALCSPGGGSPESSSSVQRQEQRTLSELVSSVLEIVNPIPKQVPVFVEIDPSLQPERLTFALTEDLTLFRVALSCLSTACERTQQGFVLLRIARNRTNGADRMLWECHDCAANVSYTDAVQITSKNPTLVPTGGDKDLPLQDPSLNGINLGLKLVSHVGGEYGYRKREIYNVDDNSEQTTTGSGGDGRSSPSSFKEGSVFWFSIPLPKTADAPVPRTAVTTSPAVQPVTQMQEVNKATGVVSPSAASPLAALFSCGKMPPPAAAKSMAELSNNGFLSLPRVLPEPTQQQFSDAATSSVPGGSSADTSFPLGDLLSVKSPVPMGVRKVTDQRSLPAINEGGQHQEENREQNNGTAHEGNGGSTKSAPGGGFQVPLAVPGTFDAAATEVSDITYTHSYADTQSTTTSQQDDCPPPTRPKLALVVDDALVIRKVLSRALAQLGYEVITAVDGQDGLDKLKDDVFDIVLCDFMMPVMDGLDCIAQFRAWEKQNRPWFRVHVVGISAHATSADADAGIKAGMDSFYPKPVTPKIIAEMLQSEPAQKAALALNRFFGILDTDNKSKSGGGSSVSSSSQYTASSASKSFADVTGANAARSVARSLKSQSIISYSSASSNGNKRTNDAAFGYNNTPVNQYGSSTRRRLSHISEEGSAGKKHHCLVALKAVVTGSFKENLDRNGWVCTFAQEGAEALEQLKARNWDAVVVANNGVPDGGYCATRLVNEFRAWEKKHRVNMQKNVFLQCCDTARAVDSLLASSDCSSLVLLPNGFDGALRREPKWSDFERQCPQTAAGADGLASTNIINRYRDVEENGDIRYARSFIDDRSASNVSFCNVSNC